MSDEYIEAMKVLWTQDRPAFHGQHVQFDNIGFDPKPVQKPHIPVWIGGNSRSAIRRAARLGDAWHPTRPHVQDIKAGAELLREFCGQDGRDPDSVMIAARLPLKFIEDGPGVATKRRPLLGSVHKVIDEIGQYRDAGVQYIVLDTFYSAPELESETIKTILETMERFAADVMPRW